MKNAKGDGERGGKEATKKRPDERWREEGWKGVQDGFKPRPDYLIKIRPICKSLSKLLYDGWQH